MPQTRVEKIIFGVVMSLCMVYGMEVYNQALLAGGLVNAGFGMSVKELFALAAIVFAVENLYGGALARKLAFRVVSPGKDRDAVVIVMVQLFTICIMCPSMSLVASILFKGALGNGIEFFLAIWVQTIAVNAPMALVWQLVVCGPLVRLLHRKVVVPLEKKLVAV